MEHAPDPAADTRTTKGSEAERAQSASTTTVALIGDEQQQIANPSDAAGVMPVGVRAANMFAWQGTVGNQALSRLVQRDNGGQGGAPPS